MTERELFVFGPTASAIRSVCDPPRVFAFSLSLQRVCVSDLILMNWHRCAIKSVTKATFFVFCGLSAYALEQKRAPIPPSHIATFATPKTRSSTKSTVRIYRSFICSRVLTCLHITLRHTSAPYPLLLAFYCATDHKV